MKLQIHSLPAGGAYETAIIQGFIGYRCKQSSAALINTNITSNGLYRGGMKRKRHVNFSEGSQFPT